MRLSEAGLGSISSLTMTQGTLKGGMDNPTEKSSSLPPIFTPRKNHFVNIDLDGDDDKEENKAIEILINPPAKLNSMPNLPSANF